MSATLSKFVRPAWTKSPSSYLRVSYTYWDRIARYLVYRAAIARLRELDDSGLRDIGLARSQIEAAVHGFMTAPNRARIG